MNNIILLNFYQILNYCIKGISDCLSGYDNFHNYKKKQNDTSENKI